MEPKIEYQIASDDIIYDPIKSKSSLIGVFNTIGIPFIQRSIIISFCIFSRVINVPSGDRTFTTIIYDSDNEEFDRTTARGTVSASDPDINLISRFPSKEISKTGDYTIKVLVDDEVVSTRKGFTVRKLN